MKMLVCEPLPTEGYGNVSVRNVDAAARMAMKYFGDEVEVVEMKTTDVDAKRKSVFAFGAMLQLLAEAGIACIDHDPYTWMSLHIKSSS